MNVNTFKQMGKMVSGDLTKQLSIVNRIVFHITNYFGKREKYVLKITGPDFKNVKVFWGLYIKESGQSLTVTLNCTSGAFLVLQKNLLKKNDVGYFSARKWTN